ncbi:AbiH family protein [Dermabacteraceae bacterium P9123]
MADLLILGNGFDLHHGLRTDYQVSYRAILRDIDSGLLKKADAIFFDDDEELWRDFEGRVGRLSPGFLKEFSNSVSNELYMFHAYHRNPKEISPFGPEDDLYGDGYAEVNYAIQSALNSKPSVESLLEGYRWLFELKEFFTKGFVRMVDHANSLLGDVNMECNFAPEVRVITFNYTETVERVYGIDSKNVLHVHGTIDPVWGNDSRALTRGEDFSFDVESDPVDLSCFHIKTPDGRRAFYPSNINDYKYSLGVDEQVDGLKKLMGETLGGYAKGLKVSLLYDFLESLGSLDVDRIFVMGHSLGDVDKEYFQLVSEKFPNALWTVSYYKSEERFALADRAKEFLSDGAYSRLELKTIREIFESFAGASREMGRCY